jgi:hypothetical protein
MLLGQSLEPAAAIADPADPDRLLDLAEHHGVLPLIGGMLAQAAFANLTGACGEMRSRLEVHTRRALRLTLELDKVLDRIKAEGVVSLPYKGPLLGEILYGSVAARQFHDLDIIIRPSDVMRVKALLAAMGYKPELHLTTRQERAYLQSGYEYTFNSSLGKNLLEIQWRIVPRFYATDFDMEALFARAIPVRLEDRTVQTLSNEDLLLVLCVHAAKHAWAQLSWLVDIARLVKVRPLNWTVIHQRADALGIDRILRVTFGLIERLLGIQIGAMGVADEKEASRIIDEAAPRLASGVEYDIESPEYFRLMLRSRERWQDRARFLARLAWTPGVSEWQAVRLPQALFPLYHVVRLGRLVNRAMR